MMMPRRRIAPLCVSLCTLCLGGTLTARADTPAPPAAAAAVDKASADMAANATKFLQSLTPEQRATADLNFADDKREDWHFIPKPKRKGLTLKEMTEEQRGLAKALLASGIAPAANTKVATIMSLEEILLATEQGKGPERDPVKYYWTVFGKPGGNGPWGWSVEGHHVSLNFTVVNDKAVVGGPIFLGDNPAEVKDGPRKGLRVLAEEEDMGRAFVKSLTPEQMKKAVILEAAPKEMITAADRHVKLAKFEGLPFAELTAPQKAALIELVSLYANRLRPELAQDDLNRINKAGVDKVYFGWAGGTEKGEPHYYRLHGPTFLVEYDDTQNNANHIHTVWRDLENDFGGDLLKQHYDHDHK